MPISTSPGRICPECNLRPMEGCTYTCSHCWDHMAGDRRQGYQNGILPTGLTTRSMPPARGITAEDFKVIAYIFAQAQRRIKYGCEQEFFMMFRNDFISKFADMYPSSVFSVNRFIENCGGDTPLQFDEERQRQREREAMSGLMPRYMSAEAMSGDMMMDHIELLSDPTALLPPSAAPTQHVGVAHHIYPAHPWAQSTQLYRSLLDEMAAQAAQAAPLDAADGVAAMPDLPIDPTDLIGDDMPDLGD